MKSSRIESWLFHHFESITVPSKDWRLWRKLCLKHKCRMYRAGRWLLMCSANPVLVINSDTLDSQTVEAVHIVRGETHCGNYVGYHTSESSAILSIIPQHSSAFLSIPQHSSAKLVVLADLAPIWRDLSPYLPLEGPKLDPDPSVSESDSYKKQRAPCIHTK